VKQWSETRAVLAALAALRESGQRGALATVIRVQGSAYRHEGAKLLVREDGSTVGNISGGCLEQDVIEVARRVMQRGTVERRAWCGGSDEISAWDLGVGCEGEVELLITPVTDDRSAERSALGAERAFAVVTRVDHEAAPRLVVDATDAHGTLGDAPLDAAAVAHARARLGAEGGELLAHSGAELSVEYLRPPPRVLIVSGADDAREVAQLADRVGFRVVVADRRPGWLEPARFPTTVQLVETAIAEVAQRVALGPEDFALVMTHDFADDTAAVAALLASEVGYVGILGPRGRTLRVHSALGRDTLTLDPRIHAPVGLDIGTDGAEQVALSIVAELLAVRSGRAPRSLRERATRIHDVAASVLR